MKKVMVGMSGGVDSSVTALILKEQGYDVSGCTLELFGIEDSGGRKCGAADNADDAGKVAEYLGFEHMVLDLRECFRERVMKSFAQTYLNGSTPNPCIECNRHVKFGEMLNTALKMGYEYIATGHYAVVEYSSERGRWLLKRPADRSKDQTYVLYSLTQEQLAHTLFPLGGMPKSEVRRIAENAGLINSKKPDSQDICFIPDGDYAQFIRRFAKADVSEGDFTDLQGKILGRHKGLIHYTIGQRKGLGISLGRPAYVVSKDTESNTVVLGEESDLYTRTLTAENVNIISAEDIDSPVRITAKTRYSQIDSPATLTKLDDGRYMVEFDEPQRAVTKGQAAVFYDGDIVVGGGTII